MQWRRRGKTSLAESALLGARLAFFDLRQVALAERCQLVAGRTADAVSSLRRALDQLDDRAGKQRSVVLLDLAAAHAATDAEHAMDFATQAFDQLEREPYGTAHGRVAAVRRALEGTPQAGGATRGRTL